MALLFLARHGETDDNRRLVFQGQSGRGLNRHGRGQAARLGSRLRGAGIDAIVASDLDRATETAAIAGDALGLHATFDRDFREVDVGAWTGKSHAQIAAEFPEEWAAWSEGFDVRRGNGETYAELAERVGRAIRRVAVDRPSGRVLVVSHGGSIKSFVAKILGVSHEGLRALAGVANCGITIIDVAAGGRMRLESWNDTAHLEGLVVEMTD